MKSSAEPQALSKSYSILRLKEKLKLRASNTSSNGLAKSGSSSPTSSVSPRSPKSPKSPRSFIRKIKDRNEPTTLTIDGEQDEKEGFKSRKWDCDQAKFAPSCSSSESESSDTEGTATYYNNFVPDPDVLANIPAAAVSSYATLEDVEDFVNDADDEETNDSQLNANIEEVVVSGEVDTNVVDESNDNAEQESVTKTIAIAMRQEVDEVTESHKDEVEQESKTKVLMEVRADEREEEACSPSPSPRIQATCLGLNQFIGDQHQILKKIGLFNKKYRNETLRNEAKPTEDSMQLLDKFHKLRRKAMLNDLKRLDASSKKRILGNQNGVKSLHNKDMVAYKLGQKK